MRSRLLGLPGLLVAATLGAQPIGQEVRVNTYTTGAQLNPSVASDAAGDFVVVWQGPGQTDGYGILGQRFAGSGAPVGGSFPVNTYTTDRQTLPGVASDAAGNFVVVWQSYYEDLSGPGVFAQRFASGGTTLGAPFRVNTVTSGNQDGPAVVSDASGNFVVAWQGEGIGGGGVSLPRPPPSRPPPRAPGPPPPPPPPRPPPPPFPP